ncbi:MAG: ribosome small subunit-dependent GTPase A, partial [Gorillibacterium sp.]|nr:ribosome small subunit-dependent GTPase A [Gorillibacterium sp.]
MAIGMIVKALSGFYYVLAEGKHPDDGDLIQCRARGILKKRNISPLVGDQVEFGLTEHGEGVVDDILPRVTELTRPPVANAELAVLVFSVDRPILNPHLLDKFLVHIESANLDTIIVLTKTDLLTPVSEIEIADIIRPYEQMGYGIYSTSSKLGRGIEEVSSRLSDVVSVFSGQSGVGKSSLLNAMLPGLTLATNEISERLGRGKHTTRHTELIPLKSGGWVADSPCFTQLDFEGLEAEDLGSCFREFRSFTEACRFRGCVHHKEPNCAVKEAVE